jgi:transcriptional regulator
MSLGKPKPHSAKEIRERREKVLILMAKGHNQSDIAKELHTTRNTIMRDIKEINEWIRKGLYDLAKQSLSTMLYSCIIGLNEIEKEAWKIYRNNGNDKVNALRLLIDICKSKYTMYESGPTVMEVNKIKNELEKLTNEARESRNQNYYSYNNSNTNNNRYLPPPNNTCFPESRKEYSRALKNIEYFPNHNHNSNHDDSDDNEENESSEI